MGIAVVTGASAGIGRATALAFAARGWDVGSSRATRSAWRGCAASSSGRNSPTTWCGEHASALRSSTGGGP